MKLRAKQPSPTVQGEPIVFHGKRRKPAGWWQKRAARIAASKVSRRVNRKRQPRKTHRRRALRRTAA